MNASRGGSANVLILRAWREAGHVNGLRVRIIEVSDRQDQSVAMAASTDEVCEVVRGWLDRLPPPDALFPQRPVTEQ